MIGFEVCRHIAVIVCIVLASSQSPILSETGSFHDASEWILEEVAGIGNPDGPWTPNWPYRTSIAVDSMDMPHIAYQNIETMATNYSYKDHTGKWHTETVVEADVRGDSPVLALTTDDRPVICYRNHTLQGLSCAFLENSSWRHMAVEVLTDVGSQISLVLDSLDRPHLAYYVVGEDTKYAWLNGMSWNITVLRDRAVSTTASIALDLDQNNRPQIALLSFSFAEKGLWLYILNGTKWDKEVIDPSHSRGIYSMELNETDSPHLATTDPTWQVPIHMYKDDGSWKTRYVDLGANVGDASFSLDSSGKPHFVYEERNEHDLRYAYMDNGSWKNETVDSDGWVGFLPSIAMDRNNIPHISYIDLTDNLLMYATKKKGIKAMIDIDPDTLNLKSKGKWVTCYIELSGGYDPRDINASTILLMDTLSPELNLKYGFVKSEESYIVDHDNDGIMERMVKFDRAEVEKILTPSDDVVLTITGSLLDGTEFEGADTIRVIDVGGHMEIPLLSDSREGLSSHFREEYEVSPPIADPIEDFGLRFQKRLVYQ